MRNGDTLQEVPRQAAAGTSKHGSAKDVWIQYSHTIPERGWWLNKLAAIPIAS